MDHQSVAMWRFYDADFGFVVQKGPQHIVLKHQENDRKQCINL